MRRRIASVVIVVGTVLLGLSPVALGGGMDESYLDRFAQVSYSGSDGTLAWDGPWFEIDEDDGPRAGAVTVDTGEQCASGLCLQVASGLLALDRSGAARFADTSVFQRAEVSYHIGALAIDSGGLLGGLTDPLSGASLTVEVTTNRGQTWTVIDSWDLTKLVDKRSTQVIKIDAYLSDGFGLQFVVEDLLGGRVFIDDVEVRGELVVSTTTTTPGQSTSSTSTSSTSTSPTTTTPTTDRPRSDGATTTTSTVPSSTTTDPGTRTTEDSGASAMPPDDAPPGAGGLRFGEHGVQAAYDVGRYGDTGALRPSLVSLTVDYRIAVESLASSWIWVSLLVLLIAGLLVTGLGARAGAAPSPVPPV